MWEINRKISIRHIIQKVNKNIPMTYKYNSEFKMYLQIYYIELWNICERNTRWNVSAFITATSDFDI